MFHILLCFLVFILLELSLLVIVLIRLVNYTNLYDTENFGICLILNFGVCSDKPIMYVDCTFDKAYILVLDIYFN